MLRTVAASQREQGQSAHNKKRASARFAYAYTTDLFCRGHITRRRICTATKKMVFHLAFQIIPRTRIGQVQAVFVHQHGLQFDPVGPGFFADIVKNLFTQFARIDLKTQAFGFFAQFDAVDHTSHIKTFLRSMRYDKRLIITVWV